MFKHLWEGASSQCDLRIGGGATNFPTLMDMVNNPIQAIEDIIVNF